MSTKFRDDHRWYSFSFPWAHSPGVMIDLSIISTTKCIVKIDLWTLEAQKGGGQLSSVFQIEGNKVFDVKAQNSPLKTGVVEQCIYLREMPKAEEETPFIFVPQSQVTVYHVQEGDEERRGN